VVQKRALAPMHFALRQGGHLLLGNAESVSGREDLFETVSKKARIFRRHGPARHDIIDFPLLPGRSPPPDNEESAMSETKGHAAPRRGFGSTLMKRSIVHQLGGTATLDFRPECLQCEIAFPWREVQSGAPKGT
jgi:hypothetical protein